MALRKGEMVNLARTQEFHMMDTCVIQTRSATDNAYNLPVETFTGGDPVECGFMVDGSREINENGQLVIVDATLRLPEDQTVSALDRIQITKRLGYTLINPEIYRIIGVPKLGPSGQVLMLKRVQDG